MRSRPLAALALFAIVAGLAIPLLGLVPLDEQGPLCCRGGRCCCEARPAADDSPCLRRSCGCGHRDSGVVPAPLRLEAALTDRILLPASDGAGMGPPSPEQPPLARTKEPPTPPPKRLAFA
jgi:hypothetical protein